MDKQEQISRRLEPRDWRTTQRENRNKFEHRATAGKWGRIASAIISYQNRNKGASPGNYTIARDANMTVGMVGYHLKRMGEAGLLQDLKGYPRVILMKDMTKVAKLTGVPVQSYASPPAEKEKGKAMSISIRNGAAYERKDFITRCKELASAIEAHLEETGKPPTIDYLRVKVYGENKSKSGGSASKIVKRMNELGWVHHKPRHRDIRLTSLGRSVLFGQQTPEPEPARVTRQKTQPPRSLADFVREVPTIIPEDYMSQVKQDPLRERVGPEDRAAALKKAEDVDLVIELTGRGFKVTR